MATLPTDPAAPTAPIAAGPGTGPMNLMDTGPVRRPEMPSIGGPLRRFLRRWGFPLFVLLVLVLARRVLLPFIFATLVAYVLAPVVRWMAHRKDGSRRMPRGLAILICYIVFIAGVVGFFFILVPRLYKDGARIGKEAPALLKEINDEVIPDLARGLEKRFPSLATKTPAPEQPPLIADVPIPPHTAFVITPLPDGTFAVQVTPTGVLLQHERGGGFRLVPSEHPAEAITLEDKLRTYLAQAIDGLRSKLDDVFRFGQALIGSLIRGIFTFFLVLMIGAFILIDMEKVHAFLRSLFPPHVRDDYDVIVEGIDRGLSGVIRGQLLICLINATLTYIGLVVFDVKYQLILAFVAGTMSLIPIFGSILSTFPIVVAAMVSSDHGIDIVRAVAMTGWIIGIHFIEANFLNPKIIGTAAKIHPVLVIFALVLGEQTYGLIGALFAVPLLSIVSVIFMFFYRKTWKEGRMVTQPLPTMPGGAPPAPPVSPA
ncbi:MAG TPA: AI-2E family transporter [Kofleriaceae bacterium]|nr:AI-2E family transporter [Kofleriaceae bacterium]